ncbi:MAG: Rpn family recombination-promoting nuclease/putative transposase, partial [Oscillospiraceae bacterium]|nr:Rpn family recombination-promoting nuclease/putative transposase [Oscillospiraceae bacterium]
MSRNGMEGGEVFDEARKILPAKFDKVFLTLFTNPKYKDIVALPFLRAYLRKPDLKPSDVIISDPRLASDELDEKHPIVDVFITMPTELLHMEMQFFVTKETLDRFFYYHAKAFAGQLKSGESYSKLKKLISLFITTQTAIDDTADENVPERGYYFHSFEVYDKIHNVTMTDKAVINVLELNKIPVKSDGSTEWIWGSLFDAEEEEQFDMLAKAYPEVADAVKVIKELSADQQFRYEAFLAEKAKRDWIS